ncbi:MAG: hypothetical protein WCD11_21065 [Solirubrobacteraceae bacterium]
MRQSDSSIRTALPSLVTVTRTLGGLALLVVGGVHFQQYQYEFYSSIPTIGPLFLATFVVATALGLFLLVPVRRSSGRLRKLVDGVAALSGVGVATGAFVGLLISEHTPLFGFMEHGYRFAIVLALTSEAVTIAMLTMFVGCGLYPSWRSGTASRREAAGAGQRGVAVGTER